MCRTAFKGPTRDDYVQPAAHYEMAVLSWVEACDPAHFPAGLDDGAPSASAGSAASTAAGEHENGKRSETLDHYRRRKVDECYASLETVAKWEGFVLDARVGMRVQTAMDSVRWLRRKKQWPGA